MKGYESPIMIADKIVTEVEKDLEGKLVAKTKLLYDIDIDPDELKKALMYDRDQYQKGYNDGKMDGYTEARKRFADLLENTFAEVVEKSLGKWESEDEND